MKLTVVICTHNRASLLANTLESVNNAYRPYHNVYISILVIANACHDDTVVRLCKYQKNEEINRLIPLSFSEESKPGKSYALNKALSLLSEGWICFIDDDHRLDNRYFQAVIDAIDNHPETTMFCGKIIPDWNGEEPAWAHEQGQYKITPYPVPNFNLGNESLLMSKNNSIPGGGNLIVNAKVFERIGKFSEELGPKGHNLMGSEDSDFVLRALSANELLRYIPTIVQYHYVDPRNFTLNYLLTKSYQRNRTITLTRCSKRSNVPLYLWSKLFSYLVKALFCFDSNKARFFLTRLAGIMGQIVGTLQSRPH